MIPRFAFPALVIAACLVTGRDWRRESSVAPVALAAPRADHPATERPLSSKEAAQRLRAMLEGESPLPKDFAEIEKLARHLHPVELMALVGALDNERSLGPPGWIRCALFAEWGRRDPGAARDFAAAPALANADSWVLRQIDFSIRRGWAETAPAAAFADLSDDPAPLDDDDLAATFFTTRAIFLGWVKMDADAAWQRLVHWPAGSPLPRTAALTGFFEGLPAADFSSRAGMVAGEWRGQQALHRARQRNLVVSLTADHYSVLPDDPESPAIIAAAWARYDPAAALAWLDACEGPVSPETLRLTTGFRWAMNAPHSAFDWVLAQAAAGERPDESLAHGLFWGLSLQDPALADASLQALPVSPLLRRVLIDGRGRAWSAPLAADHFPGLAGTRPYATPEERHRALLTLRD